MSRSRHFTSSLGLRIAAILLAAFSAGGSLATAVRAREAPTGSTSSQFSRHTQYAPSRFPKRAAMYYQALWGIDGLVVRSTESGELVRFSYHVLNAAKAKQINDKSLEPYLVDRHARVKLVIPSLEKVGQLRQTGTPEKGREYWMTFSNPRRTVKPGDRVSVVIGTFHADNLVVQ